MPTKSNKRPIAIEGREFDSIQSAASAFGLSRNTVDYRLSRGWTPEEAVGLNSRPSHAGRTAGVPMNVQGREFKTIKDAAEYYGRAYTHIVERLKAGCTIEEALGLIGRTDTLQTEYPELAKQWHPTMNASLTPDAVAPHSGQKAWWICEQGHEWRGVVNSRTRGHGCPFCAGQKPTKDRNFSTEYPELLIEWDWEKNSPNKPEDFTPRSSSQVWWRCVDEHSWKAAINNRTREPRTGCPCCTNRVLCTDGSNSLAQLRPDVAQDWHPHKNKPLMPDQVVAGGGKKVWWICKHGHEWKTTVGLRVLSGTGCPKCTNQTSRIEIAVYAELLAIFGDIEWRKPVAGYECDIFIPEGNVGIEIDGVYWHRRRPELDLAKSAALTAAGVQLFRVRESGLPLSREEDISFTWSDNVFPVVSSLATSLLKCARLSDDQRSRLQKYIEGAELLNQELYRDMVANLPAPPPGESLADTQPEIAAQWAYDLNAPLLPEHFRRQASKNVWWRCSNGHTWKVTINNRTQHGTGCPVCPRPFVPAPEGMSLADLNPELASEWHPEKNGDLSSGDIRPKSNRKVWWICDEGHEWESTVNTRAGGAGCPYCYGRYAIDTNNLAVKHPELLSEWDREKNEGLKPSSITPYSNKTIWWRCKQGHSWQATVANRTGRNSGCPACARSANRRYSIEDFQTLAEKRGGKCLSEKYTSSRSKLKFRCKKGHIWEARADGVLYANHWCPVCANQR